MSPAWNRQIALECLRRGEPYPPGLDRALRRFWPSTGAAYEAAGLAPPPPFRPLRLSRLSRLGPLLHERGISLAELARRMGIDSRAVHRLVSLHRGAPPELLADLARELDVSEAYLTAREEKS